MNDIAVNQYSQAEKIYADIYGPPLELDIYKNNFSQARLSRCPNSSFYIDLIYYDNDFEKFKRQFVRCKSWDCPYCGKINSWVLKKRIGNALIGLYDEMIENEIDPLHCFKFLTLTAPGAEYRAANSKDECEKQMKKHFKNLMGVLKRKYGNDIEYFWTCEKQRDGYPHLHVLFAGSGIRSRSVKKTIEKVWRDLYKMGFVKINSAFKSGLESGQDFEKLISYLTKYISKEMSTGLKGYRVFSMSRKSRKMSMLEKKEVTITEFGRITENDYGEKIFEKIWDIGNNVTLDIKSEIENALVNDLGDWFDLRMKEVKKGIQLELPFYENKFIDLSDYD